MEVTVNDTVEAEQRRHEEAFSARLEQMGALLGRDRQRAAADATRKSLEALEAHGVTTGTLCKYFMELTPEQRVYVVMYVFGNFTTIATAPESFFGQLAALDRKRDREPREYVDRVEALREALRKFEEEK